MTVKNAVLFLLACFLNYRERKECFGKLLCSLVVLLRGLLLLLCVCVCVVIGELCDANKRRN